MVIPIFHLFFRDTLIDHCLDATVCPMNPSFPSWKTRSLQQEASSASTYTAFRESIFCSFPNQGHEAEGLTVFSSESSAKDVRVGVASSADNLAWCVFIAKIIEAVKCDLQKEPFKKAVLSGYIVKSPKSLTWNVSVRHWDWRDTATSPMSKGTPAVVKSTVLLKSIFIQSVYNEYFNEKLKILKKTEITNVHFNE